MRIFGKDRKLGVAINRGRYDLPLNKDEGTNFLRLLIALMSFLAAMALWDPLESTCRHASLSIL